ncbi:MAG: tetratricopeptide repeat protein [Planctomycetia bacterium]
MRAATIAAVTWTVSVSLAGCSGRPAAVPKSRLPAGATVSNKTAGDSILAGALAVIERLDEYLDDEAARQVSERITEWRRLQPAVAGPHPDPLLFALPERLRVDAEARQGVHGSEDFRGLRDLCWLAGVARQARERRAGEDAVAVAAELFDWTVRSLASVADPPAVPTADAPGSRWLLPGEILLSGRASGPQRAWIFLELLRQAGIDGVMLATGGDDGLRPWLPAAIIDGEAYLFDPAYGMPVPGPGGVGIATARQAAADTGILRALSLPDRPYPVQAADVTRLVPLVAADHWLVSGRGADMAAAFDRLHGPRVTLDTAGVLDRAREGIPGAVQGRGGFWEFPFETLSRRRADPGRLRSAVQADLAPLDIPTLPSVIRQYARRPPVGTGADREESRFDIEERPDGPRFLRPLFAARVREFRGDIAGAREAYLASRPSPREIAEAVATVPPQARDGLTRTLERMREDAGYWLGILSLAAGEDRSAVDFLQRVTLGEHPQGRWTDAARVNLAAALIGLGKIKEATQYLRADESPQRFGSRLQANAERP